MIVPSWGGAAGVIPNQETVTSSIDLNTLGRALTTQASLIGTAFDTSLAKHSTVKLHEDTIDTFLTKQAAREQPVKYTKKPKVYVEPAPNSKEFPVDVKKSITLNTNATVQNQVMVLMANFAAAVTQVIEENSDPDVIVQ